MEHNQEQLYGRDRANRDKSVGGHHLSLYIVIANELQDNEGSSAGARHPQRSHVMANIKTY